MVFVVDDDSAVLRALTRLIAASGLEARPFASPAAFLAAHDFHLPGCAVIDVAMPGLNGLELQEKMVESGSRRPIIFLTGYGDIPTTVRAMKAGAADFLTKPVDEQVLLTTIGHAIEKDAAARELQEEGDSFRQRYASLTPRECQVFAHVAAGRLNKQIAGDLGIVDKTIKVHRARVMEKMNARSLADLVRIADRLGLDRLPGR
ncbi:response regulator [Mesorhizobium sp. WSM2561]|uniref:response regulator transcription factor n=1 Tax=Mesorhizobium sp. WSM2561 TaxID=1040985 RepID=UPI0004B5BE78|nr:response regulator [Mesorhizobium sp. WSM2561]